VDHLGGAAHKIAEDEFSALGDTSTLADPSVVDDLVENRQNRKDR
jgi:acetyl-CoA synthetase